MDQKNELRQIADTYAHDMEDCAKCILPYNLLLRLKTMENLKEELREEASKYGIDLFGVASAQDLSEAPAGHRPNDVLPGAKSIIILGLKMLDAQTNLLPLEGDTSSSSPRPCGVVRYQPSLATP